MNKPLSGIKVLELSTFVAGPCCARLLSDLGAEVIKVEKAGGDPWRSTGKSYLPRFKDDENPIFDLYNTGKRHVVLNLKDAEGKEAFHKLLSTCDVFVTNNRPDALKRMGLDYESLREQYPQLIYAILLGYGEKGPDAARAAFDTTAFWTRTGFIRDLAVIDDDHYMPIQPPSSMGDTVSGMFLMGEICAALYNRTKTGKGDYVRSGLYHNGIFTMGTMALQTQRPFGRLYPSSRVDNGVPGGSYRCADNEYIYIAVANAAVHVPKLCQAIGRPDLMEDERFTKDRYTNRHIFYPIFRDAFASQTTAYWLQKADELDLPLMKMAHFADISEDEQAWANGYLEHVEFGSGNVDVVPASPVEMDSVGQLKTVPCPPAGAHTRDVLAELGYSPEQIEAMLAAGAAAEK